MLNQEQILNRWKEIKGAIRNIWGNIDDEELEFTKGNIASVYNVIKNHSFESEDEIRHKIDILMESFDNESDKSEKDLNQSSFQRRPFLH